MNNQTANMVGLRAKEGYKMQFQFKNSKVLKDVIRTVMIGGCKLPYGEGDTDEAGVWLVKDEGVYVMPSNREKVIYPYHAALTVLCGRSSEHVSEVPRTFNDEDWSDYTQRCAYAMLLEIAGDFVGDYYDAANPYHEEEDA